MAHESADTTVFSCFFITSKKSMEHSFILKDTVGAHYLLINIQCSIIFTFQIFCHSFLGK